MGPLAELLDVLDAQGRAMARLPRDEVHAKGLLHRCVHVFVLDPGQRLWLQRRALDRELWPGLWTSTASGHVEAGEPEEGAARRELAEEMGLETPLRRVAEFRFRDAREHEVAGLWVGASRDAPRPGPEVMAVQALARGDLAALRARRAGDFAPSFGAALRAFGWA